MKSKQTNNMKLLSPFVSLFLSFGLQRPQKDLAIDWSTDIPESPVSPSLYIPLASEYVLSSHDLLHNTGSNGKNRAEFAASSLLYYGEG